jgi:hypothetical protein
VAGIVIIGLSYVPLLASELATGFAETQAATSFFAAGGASVGTSLPVRVLIVALRILAWPLTGLVTNAPLAALVAAAAVIAILAWRSLTAPLPERVAARWFGLTLAWSALALAVGAATLATVVPGLPNDHYHAFLDPIVFVTVGIGAAALWRLGYAAPRLVAVAAVAAVAAFNLLTWPPRVSPDGGWPAAERAAARVATATAATPYSLVGVPPFKATDAYGFPLVRAEHPPAAASIGPAVVVVCDRLFEATTGAPCGGPAEDAAAALVDSGLALADRFDASARTAVSVYLPR